LLSLLRLASCVFALSALIGCGGEDSSFDPPVDLPRCGEVGAFGNGKRCLDDSGAVDLSHCGSGPAVGCSPGRLCYERALYLSCSCTVDADCAAHTDYVNAARAALGQPPVEARCEGSSCAADLDVSAPPPTVEDAS
jgi:hypothetical protein